MTSFWERELSDFFTRHPHEQGMTYWQHLRRSMVFSFEMSKGALALLIHGLMPQFFQTTGTQTVKQLYEKYCVKTE